jgi:phosphoribosyl 1,2-cyclic phosphodiesterase
MRVRFWGTRGSIPVGLTTADVRDRLAAVLMAASGKTFASPAEAHAFASALPFSLSQTYGGHTSCVELEKGMSPSGGGADEYFVCDMGSGARAFGEHVLAKQAGRRATINVFMSHVHWDHIMGFPFFGPAYVPGMRLRIHGCHEVLEQAFRLQQSPPCFPVTFDQLGASIEFVRLLPGEAREVSGLRVTPLLQRHSGDSYGYRFEAGGRSMVYSTDSEHKLEDRAETERFVAFFRGADLVVFDAMYSLAEAISVKADWGHSSNVIGVELCQMAEARHLVLFHHEPANNDAAIESLLKDARRLEELTRGPRPLKVSAAHDGLEIDL